MTWKSSSTSDDIAVDAVQFVDERREHGVRRRVRRIQERARVRRRGRAPPSRGPRGRTTRTTPDRCRARRARATPPRRRRRRACASHSVTSVVLPKPAGAETRISFASAASAEARLQPRARHQVASRRRDVELRLDQRVRHQFVGPERSQGAFGAHYARCNVAELLFDAVEREQLCDLLDELGPQAPTLLDPWTTHDLAAHLVLREHDLLAAPGLVVPGAWGRFAERRRLALKETEFTDLVATIRSGPPPGFFRIGWVRRVPEPQRVLRPSRGRAPGKRLRSAHQPARRRRRALSQRRPCALVPVAPAARRRARPRMGRNGQGHQSAARATDRSPEWASRRTAPVPVRTAGRG